MKTLILGGTRFMGRLLTEKLLKRPQFDVHLFNRGKTDPNRFSTVKRIVGDRETEDLDQILAYNWDVIVDFSSYHPNSLEKIIKKLKGKVGRYVYISTVSVYPDEVVGIKEETCEISLCSAEMRGETSITAKNYGPKKAECERILLKEDWLDAVILRPSIVYGRYDYTERLFYWLYRVKNENRIAIPNDASKLSNFTFVEDMVEIILQAMVIPKHRKVYNTSTHEPNSLLKKLSVMSELLGTTPKLIGVPVDKLLGKKGLPGGIPCWRSKDILCFSHSKLLEDFSINLTSFEQSIARTIAYHNENNLWKEGAAGIRVAEEQAFLDRWN